VTSARYREGGPVAAGAVLFTIDARPYQAALARAQAELSRAQANVELARLNAGRSDKLIDSNAITRAEHDTTRSTAAASEAELRAAAAAVELARLDVEFTEVRAPIAGRVGQALVSRGDYVAAGPAPTVLTTVVSLDPVYAYFTGDEQTFLRFGSHAIGAAAHVGLADEPDFPHDGKIDFVDNRLDAQTGTIRLRAVLANPDHRLTPGLYARVRLTEATTERAALVADRAVLTDQDRKYVYIVATSPAGDVVERRDVKLGRVLDGQRVITSGVHDGDRVIVGGVQKVFPGARITVSAPAAADKTAERNINLGGRP
jgi:multidrug efflux system membrane fusion protein